jgi:hypothetical protein
MQLGGGILFTLMGKHIAWKPHDSPLGFVELLLHFN